MHGCVCLGISLGRDISGPPPCLSLPPPLFRTYRDPSLRCVCVLRCEPLQRHAYIKLKACQIPWPETLWPETLSRSRGTLGKKSARISESQSVWVRGVPDPVEPQVVVPRHNTAARHKRALLGGPVILMPERVLRLIKSILWESVNHCFGFHVSSESIAARI